MSTWSSEAAVSRTASRTLRENRSEGPEEGSAGVSLEQPLADCSAAGERAWLKPRAAWWKC